MRLLASGTEEAVTDAAAAVLDEAETRLRCRLSTSVET
jgi:hypothetical protein